MNEDFARQVLRMVVGKVCQPLGVHGMQSSVCETMADVLKGYLLTLARTTASYSVHANRTEPNLTDLAQAFRVLRIDISDLNEFLEEVESSPLDHQIPRFPIPRNSSHVYHGPTSYGETSKRRSRAPSLSSEDEEFDHIPPYLPPLPSQIDADKAEDSPGGSIEVGEPLSEANMKDDIATPTPLDPHKGLPQLFRPRGFSSDFSEDGDTSRRNSVSEGGVTVSTPEALPVKEPPIISGGLIITKAGVSQETAKVNEVEMRESECTQSGENPDLKRDQKMTDFPSNSEKFVENLSTIELSSAEAKQTSTSNISIPKSEDVSNISQAFPKLEQNHASTIPPVSKLPKHGQGSHHPPPLRLMSPSSEQVSFFPGHPNLSPILRSPSGRAIRFTMPTLSPLHTTPIRLPPPLMSKIDLTNVHGATTSAETTPISPKNAHPSIPSLTSDPVVHKVSVNAPSLASSALTSTKHPLPTETVMPASLEEKTKESLTAKLEISPSQSPNYKMPKSPQKVPLKRFSIDISRSHAFPSPKSYTPTPEPEEELDTKQVEQARPVAGGIVSHWHVASEGGVVSKDVDEVTEKLSDLEHETLDSSPSPVSSPLLRKGQKGVVTPSSNLIHEKVTTPISSLPFPVQGKDTSLSPRPVQGKTVSPSPSLSPLPLPVQVKDTSISPSLLPGQEEETTPPSPLPLESDDYSVNEFLDINRGTRSGSSQQLDGGKGEIHGTPISSGDEEDSKEEVFSFEQEMIPDRLSLSPPQVQISAPPTSRDIPTVASDVITEEIATLNSGIGGRSSVSIEETDGDEERETCLSETRGHVIVEDIMRESTFGNEDNDVMQTVIGRESPPSDDDILQSSAKADSKATPPGLSHEVRGVLDQNFSSDESDDSGAESDVSPKDVLGGVSGSRVIIQGSTAGTTEVSNESLSREQDKVGVGGSRQELVRVVSTEKVERSSSVISKSSFEEVLGIRKSGRAPPLSNRSLPPTSTLVVHVRRHMVPSLRQKEEVAISRLKTKAEMKAEVVPQMSYATTPTPPTPSSSPTPLPSPAPIMDHPDKLPSLKVSIHRRLLRHSRHGMAALPTDDSKSSANRIKKLLARFGGGGGGATTPPAAVQGTASPVHPPTHVPNPRKRELDVSEIVFPNGSHSKRLKQDNKQVEAAVTADVSSSSSSSSSEEEETGSESPSATPSPFPLMPPQLYPSRPRTPSSIDEEETVMSPESTASSLGGSGGLKLTISKSLLPPATVQHLGGHGSEDRGSFSQKKSRKVNRPQKMSTADLPIPTAHRSESIKVSRVGSKGGGAGGRGGVSSGRGSKGSRGRLGLSGLQKKGPGLVVQSGSTGKPLQGSMTSLLPLSQGSETICPECGLKDDGSPMIGCDHCDSWVHWVCGGITEAPPEDQKWYCPDCRKAGVGVVPEGKAPGGKKRGRKRKNKQL